MSFKSRYCISYMILGNAYGYFYNKNDFHAVSL